MKSIIVLKVIGWVLLSLPGADVTAQVANCNQGVPGGYGSICVDPWSPVAGASFALNFSSPHCVRFTHEYQIATNADTIDIYITHGGGCFGVPQTPLQFFTTQAGLVAGQYTVNLHRRSVSAWPAPPFNPGDFQLYNSVNFTVRGAPQATPVHTGGPWSWMALVLGLVALTIRRSRAS